MANPKRRANRGERTIITIHGIRTDGPWQECFEEVFGPHFHYESFKYSEFQSSWAAIFLLGLEWVGLAAALSTALLVALVLVLLAWKIGWPSAAFRLWLAAIFSLATVVLAALTLAVANSLANRRRERVVSGFNNFVASAVGNGQAPHIVAHSLGSFVLGRTLFRFPEFKTAKIILLGCVLKPEFEWDTLRTQFDLVRNELGAKDWVGSIASLMRPFVPEMGPSGKKGFSKPSGLVERRTRDNSGAPWRPCVCGVCYRDNSRPAVLNIDGPDIGHTDLTAVKIRAQRRWLPFFWNIPPDHYERFVDLCLECDTLHLNGDPNLAHSVAELLNGCWYWSKGPLKDFLHTYLSVQSIQPDQRYLELIATNLFLTVAEANRATDRAQRQYLYPIRAVTFAVQRTRRETGS